jgi:hypothetical protein
LNGETLGAPSFHAQAANLGDEGKGGENKIHPAEVLGGGAIFELNGGFSG